LVVVVVGTEVVVDTGIVVEVEGTVVVVVVVVVGTGVFVVGDAATNFTGR
jgi:hypothetical protein